MSNPTTTVRIPVVIRERAERAAVTMTAREQRIVQPSEVLARAAERGLDAMLADSDATANR